MRQLANGEANCPASPSGGGANTSGTARFMESADRQMMSGRALTRDPMDGNGVDGKRGRPSSPDPPSLWVPETSPSVWEGWTWSLPSPSSSESGVVRLRSKIDKLIQWNGIKQLEALILVREGCHSPLLLLHWQLPARQA